MPNIVSNYLWLLGDASDLDGFRRRAMRYIPAYTADDVPPDDQELLPLCLTALVPEPREIRAADLRIQDDWRFENWGTKWDVDDSEVIERGEGIVGYRFWTLWTPAFRWVEAVARRHPELTFRYVYLDLNGDDAARLLFRGGLEIFHYCRHNLFMEMLRQGSINHERIPVGDEDASWDWQAEVPCAACGAAFGEYHKLGCKKEQCPFCQGQLVSCGCQYERQHCGAA